MAIRSFSTTGRQTRLALPLFALCCGLAIGTEAPPSQAQVAMPVAPKAAAPVAPASDAFATQLKAAQRLMDDEKYDEAAQAIKELIKASPQNYALYLMLSTAYGGQYEVADAPDEEKRALRLSRDSLITAQGLTANDPAGLKIVNEMLGEVQQELKTLKADTFSPAPVLPPPPKPANVPPTTNIKPQPPKPQPAPLRAPQPAPQSAPQPAPAPVEATPAPAPIAALAPLTPAPLGMSSNLPLSLPGPAVAAKTNDPLLLAKETKNRKYPTHAAYDELGNTYAQMGLYDDAVRNYRTNAQLYRQSNGIQSALIYEQLAGRYQNDIQLFVDRPLSNSEQSVLNTGATAEPPVGTYLGAFIDRDDRLKETWSSEYFQTHRKPAEFAQIEGKPHATFFMYAEYGQVYPAEWLQHCKDARVIPQLAWEPQGGLGQVQENDYLIDFAKKCGQLNWPIFLRFASEMNGGWTKWGGNPDLYREKFRLVNRVFKQYAPRVALIWCVNCVPVENILSYYPGDDSCDWVGINLYSVPFYSETSAAKPGDLDAPSDFIRPIYDQFKDRKPIALCEYAASQMHAAEGKPRIDFAVNKMSLLYGSLPRLFPRIKMVSWFDQNNIKFAPAGRRINDYSLTENGIVLKAYQSLVNNDPYFIPGGQTLDAAVVSNAALAVPRPATPNQNVQGMTRFSIWVRSPIQRPLVYLQIGDKIVYAAKRPGVNIVDVDTSQFKGRQPVTVYAYNDAGKFIGKQTTSLLFGKTRGDDGAPILLTGTITNYLTDPFGRVTAMTLQNGGSELSVRFAPELAQSLLDQYPANGPFTGWVRPDSERGPGYWELLSPGEEKPATFPRPSQNTDYRPQTTDVPATTVSGNLTGVVTDDQDHVVALELDNQTLINIAPALTQAAPQNATPPTAPLSLQRGVTVSVTAQSEAMAPGAVSAFATRMVASDVTIDGRRASEVGLPLVTVKERRAISAQPKPVKVRGESTTKNEGFTIYLPPAHDAGTGGRTRGGGVASLFPTNVRPW